MNGTPTSAADRQREASETAVESSPLDNLPRPQTFTRVDAPHAAATRRAADGVKLLELADPDEAPLALPPPDSASQEQLREQAQELAEILRQRQRDLDRREALLASLAARSEGEERSWRLSLAEKERAFDERARQQGELAAETERRATALALAEAEIEHRRAELETSQQAVAEREATAAAAERRLDERRAAHAQEVAFWRERTRDAAMLEETRRAQREESESLLESQLRDLARERDLFAADCSRRETALAAESESLAEERRRLVDRQRRRAAALDEREKRLALREQALDRVGEQVDQTHRRALESRLIVEQVWSQLRREAPPRELSIAAAQAEWRLAHESLLAEDALAERQRRLCDLSASLREQLESLSAKRTRWQQSRCAQHRAIERRLVELAERERSIEEQAERFAAKESAWLAERRRLVARLRGLLDAEREGEGE